MEQLELKKEHLKHYLYTGLEIIGGRGVTELTEDLFNWCITNTNQQHDRNFGKPIFHPLSDITKEIEHNEKKFVPANELQKYVDANNGLLKFEPQDIYDLLQCQYWVIEKLIEWHFWIFDQSYFEKGIIIDKSTLTK